jgi:hypothetical protein
MAITRLGGANAITGTIPNSVLAAGNVIQVVSSTKSDTSSTSSTSYSDISGLSVSITPSSTSSKILVSYNFVAGTNDGYDECHVSLFRDSTDLKGGSSTGTSYCPVFHTSTSAKFKMYNFAFEHLDSPSSTSSLTYKLRFNSQSGQILYINTRGATDSGATNWTNSSITAMEIAQ